MLKAIKIRLYPNNDQMIYMNKLLGSCRFVYNNILAYKISEYNNNKHSVSFGEAGKYLIKLKENNKWLKEAHSKVLQQSLINLEQAYKSFFKNSNGFPKFKSRKETKQSCRFPDQAISSINGNRINIIKVLKDIHFKCSKQDEKYLNKNFKDIKSATLTKTKDNKYYFSLLIDRQITKVLPTTDEKVGIDLGIKDFIISSNGDKFENIKVNRNNQQKLKRLNQLLSRKQKGSKNKEKCRIKLSKFNAKLTNIKENYLHAVVNKLLNENQVIIMEDLNVSGMLKNHKLAKSIQELSLYRFKTILEYKANWYGRDIIQIDRFYPSTKLCNDCGFKNNDLTLEDRQWTCPSCKSKHDRDLNASKNILKEGLKILKIGSSSPELTEKLNAFGDSVRPEMAVVVELGKECKLD
jgi:putative transposase